MNKITLLLVLFLTFSVSSAQTKYLDWNLQEINQEIFTLKMRSGKYTSSRVQVDSSFKFMKLRRKEVFGKLDTVTLHQLRSALAKFEGVDVNKTLFVHYIDTMPVVANLSPRDTIIIEEKVDENGNTYTSHTHLQSFNTERKNLLKELNFMKKFKEVEFVHLSNVLNDYPVWIEGHKMMEDPMKSFRKVFSDGLTPYKNILLFSDGEFLMTDYKMCPKQVKKLINRKKFDKEKKKWKSY